MAEAQLKKALGGPRERIDDVDARICELLLTEEYQAALANNPDRVPANYNLPEAANAVLDNNSTPADLVMTVAKYIDVSQLEEHQQEALFTSLATLLAERYDVVLDVAQAKREKGERDSYHHGRHSEVVDNYGHAAQKAGLTGLFWRIGQDIADKMVEYQNHFLNNDVDPTADPETYKNTDVIAYTFVKKGRDIPALKAA